MIVHMDDTLIHGRNEEEHDARVRKVLSRLQEAGVTLASSRRREAFRTRCQRGRDRSGSLQDNGDPKLPCADKHHGVATVPWDGKPGCEIREEPSVKDGTSESSTEKGK